MSSVVIHLQDFRFCNCGNRETCIACIVLCAYWRPSKLYDIVFQQLIPSEMCVCVWARRGCNMIYSGRTWTFFD